MKITKDTKLPDRVKETIRYLRNLFGYNLKITDFPKILESIIGIDIDDWSSWSSQFESYLIDLQKKFMEGGELDLTVFHQDVVNVFHLSKLEKTILVKNNIEEKLWAIMCAVSDSLHKSLLSK